MPKNRIISIIPCRSKNDFDTGFFYENVQCGLKMCKGDVHVRNIMCNGMVQGMHLMCKESQKYCAQKL